jgi:hypothetical protein
MRAAIERALHPLDLVRQELLRAFVQVPALRPLVSRRDPRVLVGLSVHGLVALALTLYCPSLLLVLTPIVLGVPHIAADVRYLLIRPQLPRGWVWCTLLFSAGMLTLRAAAPAAPTQLEHALGGTWLLWSAWLGAQHSGALQVRHALVVFAALALASAALHWPGTFGLALMHGHNVVALLLWLVLFRRFSLSAWLVALGLLLMAAALASGAAVRFTLAHGLPSAFGVHLFRASDWIAYGVADRWAVGLTMSFAFLQSIHYGIWLFAIPQQALRRDATLSWRMSYHGLLNDFGSVGLLAVCALSLLVIACGALAPLPTRNVYLSFAGFHAWFELASLLYLLSSGAVGGPPGGSNRQDCGSFVRRE